MLCFTPSLLDHPVIFVFCFLGMVCVLVIDSTPITISLATTLVRQDFPGGSDGKVSVYNVGDLGSIPRLGRFPGERNGNSLQYYCLENPMGRGDW